MHQSLTFIYFELTLYMFRTDFPSIIRSSRLYIQQQVYVKQILRPANLRNWCIQLVYYRNMLRCTDL
jgi:hypothetical protein